MDLETLIHEWDTPEAVSAYVVKHGDAPTAAANALADAVRRYEGRRLHIDRFRPIVGALLCKKRVRDSVWQEVLDWAQALGLLTVNRTDGAYPFFVLPGVPEANPVPPEEETREVTIPDTAQVASLRAMHSDPYLAAAQGLYDAVRRYTGRRLHIDRWRPVVGAVLGRRQVRDVVWDPVLDAAAKKGWLTVDRESGAYPFFVVGSGVSVSEETEEPAVEDHEEIDDPNWDHGEGVSWNLRPPPPAPPPPSQPPEDWNYADYMPCGHLSFTCTETECKRPKAAPNYRFVSGKYRVPVPPHQRRTPEKERMGGFPGLVVDSDGFYAGGLFNQPEKSRRNR